MKNACDIVVDESATINKPKKYERKKVKAKTNKANDTMKKTKRSRDSNQNNEDKK